MPRKHPFIVLEAINAAGKTTQFNLLIKFLQQQGYTVHHYHFHQRDQATGQLIENKFLLSKNKGQFSRREQALLYIQDFYSRADEINEILHKKSGKHIFVSDRFYTSTLAYQTIGLSGQRRQDMLRWLTWLCEEGTPRLPQPDQVILLDTPISISLNHLGSNKKKDYFENRTKLTALRNSYLRLAKEQNWTIVDSVTTKKQQRPIQAIHQEIVSTLTPLTS